MFNWLTGTLAKYLLVASVAVMALGGAYLAWTKFQLSRAETEIAEQKAEIVQLSDKVSSLQFDKGVQSDVIDALEERLSKRQQEIENLNDEVQEILSRPEEDDGEVAPVLRDVL